jgi:hypothetical protein
MAQALGPEASGSRTVTFELDRLEQTASGRLELTGRWSGVRGRLFVRPTLTFELDGQPYRLLADLEHKPWLADEGEPWTAAFSWAGGKEGLKDLELSVAPDILVELGGSDRHSTVAARTSRHLSPHDRAESLRRELDGLRQELTDERQVSDQLREELVPLRDELQTLRADVDQLRTEKVEADAALARRDAALARLSTVEAERDETRKSIEEATAEGAELRRVHRRVQSEREHAVKAADQLRAELELARQQHARLVTEREQALRARDQALLERDRALAERDELARLGESIQSQRAAARALVTRRNLAWRPVPWSTLGRSNPEILRRDGSWARRVAAIAMLVLVVLAILVLLHAL